MGYFRTSGEGDNEATDAPMEDFDPNDPDAVIVHYELHDWAPEDQAELAAALAEQGIAHSWGEPNELLVPESAELLTDEVIARMEELLGVGLGATQPDTLGADEPSVEYSLDEWPDEDRQAIAAVIEQGGIRHRWEDHVLVVAADDEATVDEVLNAVERGEVIGDDAIEGDDETPELPFETLTTFFLAGDRLARSALDADGLAHLLSAVDVADPANPPYGVERGLWQRACALADSLAGALADQDEPDVVAAEGLAAQLRDLLRTSV